MTTKIFSPKKRAKILKRVNETRDLTIDACAKLLGVSTTTVIRYRRMGVSPMALKIPKKREAKTLLPGPVEILQRQGMMIIAIGPEDLVVNSLKMISEITGGTHGN